MTLLNALSAAEQELARSLPLPLLPGDAPPAHRRDIVGGSAADAWTLLASVLVLQASHDRVMPAQQLLAQLSEDLDDDGVVGDAGLVAALQAAASHWRGVEAIRRLQAWYRDRGYVAQTDQAVAWANLPPEARTGPAVVGLVGESINLDARASSDPDGGELAYSWTIERQQNDGPWANSALERIDLHGPSVTFTPLKTASYKVTLKVTDDLGAATVVETLVIARYRFRDNFDGTVTNEMTGLMWQQRDDGMPHTMSEATGRSLLGRPNENNGLSVCPDLVLAGYDDWRTQRLNEVESLRDFTFAAPQIDHAAFPSARPTGLISDSWSPNSMGNFVEFAAGMVLRESVDTRYPLRCVRP